MDMIRRTKAEPLRALRDEVDDLFGRFFEGTPFGGGDLVGTWYPALDVAEQEKEYLVQAELPGMKADEVEISVLNNTLTISGAKTQEKEKSGRNWAHVERRYGTFRRSIQLPAGVEPDKVAAEFRDGVLTITLPKSEKSLPRKISVKG